MCKSYWHAFCFLNMQSLRAWQSTPVTSRTVSVAAMASKFLVLKQEGQARLGTLEGPSGKALKTPALLVSTTHGHCIHNDNSALVEWRQHHPDLAVAISGVQM
jgi:hypothetical protein